MIKAEFFTYTDEQWNPIREQVLDDLGVDVDTVTHQVTHFGRTGTLSFRDRIEVIVGTYHVLDASNRRKPRRDELDALRKNAKNMHASIISTLSVQLDVGRGVVVPRRFDGVDADMLDATSDYFRKLAAHIDRQIKQAGRRGDNSRKPARDQCWNELRARWCELGGKPRGLATAKFVRLASLPVMNSAVPDLASVKQWLERHPAQ